MLDFANDDVELAKSMQQIFGYGLTGENVEKKLYVNIGRSNSGKSTWFNQFMSRILGPKFYCTCPAKMFAKTQGPTSNASAPSPELIRLNKKRVVFISEPEKDAKMNESQIKSFT